MIKINKKLIVRMILAVWIVLWLLFLIRPYFKKDLIADYRALLSRDLDGKRSFVTGDELYGFIGMCRLAIPEANFTYAIEGLDGEDDALSRCRMLYYLYPAMTHDAPEYILVYKKAGFGREGYEIFKKLSDDKIILKKRR